MEYPVDTIKLRKRMVEKSFDTISGLADTAKINRNQMGKICRGKARPSADIMYKLVETLSLSPSEAGEIFFSDVLRNT